MQIYRKKLVPLCVSTVISWKELKTINPEQKKNERNEKYLYIDLHALDYFIIK